MPFLPVKEEFHPKRNQARQKLATLPPSRFEDLSSDVYFELARRYPEFKEDVRTIATALSLLIVTPTLPLYSPLVVEFQLHLITMITLPLDSPHQPLPHAPNQIHVFQVAHPPIGPAIVAMVVAFPVADHQKIDEDRAKTIQCHGAAKTTTGDPMIHLLLVCPRMASHQPHHRDENPHKILLVAQKTVIATMIIPVDLVQQLARAETVTAMQQSMQRRVLLR